MVWISENRHLNRSRAKKRQKTPKIKEIMWSLDFIRRKNREKQGTRGKKWRFFHNFATFVRERLPDGIVGHDPPPHLLRPPGVRRETNFFNLCIRCGECMKVCINNALQPAGMDAGVKGLFSPVLIPRLNYCEYGCTLCGQVCPTGAIPNLVATVKNKTVIGKAAIDRKRCLPWAKDEECLVCQEQCPLPQKAITITTCLITQTDGKIKLLKRPHVSRDLCIGCGICENKCPLDGPAAIRVYRKDAVPPVGNIGSKARQRKRLGGHVRSSNH